MVKTFQIQIKGNNPQKTYFEGLTQSCRIPIIYKVENFNVAVKQSSKCLWENVKDDKMPKSVGKTITDFISRAITTTWKRCWMESKKLSENIIFGLV